MRGTVEDSRGAVKSGMVEDVKPEMRLDRDVLASLRQARNDARAAGQDIVDMTMICPDFPPPRVLVDRLVESALKPSSHRYGVSRGLRCLREAFATKYEERFGVTVQSESEICATLGTKDALLSILQTVTRPGDVLLVASPTYPVFFSLAALTGVRLETFSIGADDWELRRNLAEAVHRVHPSVVLLNFPNNPTGRSIDAATWAELAATVQGAQAVLVNDFTYGEFSHSGSGAAPSALAALSKRRSVVETYSLSKAYAVPGWRVAAVIGDADIVGQVARRKSHADYGGFLATQVAASHGLTSSEDLVAPLRTEIMHRAQVAVRLLTSEGWAVSAPAAGMCLWARPPRCSLGDELGTFKGAAQIARRIGVCMLPGEYFGGEWRDFVRLALVVGEERLRDASGRLASEIATPSPDCS